MLIARWMKSLIWFDKNNFRFVRVFLRSIGKCSLIPEFILKTVQENYFIFILGIQLYYQNLFALGRNNASISRTYSGYVIPLINVSLFIRIMYKILLSLFGLMIMLWRRPSRGLNKSWKCLLLHGSEYDGLCGRIWEVIYFLYIIQIFRKW